MRFAPATSLRSGRPLPEDDAHPPVRLNRTMACTRSEFLGWLRVAAHPVPVRVQGDLVTMVLHDGCVEIALDEQPPRRLGPMSLPCLGVSFCFRGVDEHARDAFIARLDLISRRGGG